MISVLAVLVSMALSVPVVKDGDDSPAVGGGVSPVVVKACTTKRSKAYRGVMSIRSHMTHITPALVTEVEETVKRIVSKAAFKWLTPELLIGLAINESDLRPGLKHGYDCGVTQVRITSIRSRKKAKAYCKRLASDMEFAFTRSAEMLTEIRDRHCRYWWRKYSETKLPRYEWRFRRCLLNVYNQGPWYYRREACKGEARCRVKARYWNRVTCFATAVKLGRKPRWRCRKAWSDRWVRRAYRLGNQQLRWFNP